MYNQIAERSSRTGIAEILKQKLALTAEQIEPFLDFQMQADACYCPTTHRLFNQVMEQLTYIVMAPIGPNQVEQIVSQLSPAQLSILKTFTAFAEARAELYQAQKVLECLDLNFEYAKRHINAFDTRGLSETQIRLERLKRFYTPNILGTQSEFRMFEEYVCRSTAEVSMLLGEGSGDDCVVAFAGSGPVDLSADLMIILAAGLGSNLHVQAIDIDSQAIRLSQELHQFKVDLDILPADSKTFYQHDLCDLTFTNCRASVDQEKNLPTCFSADCLFLAVMLPIAVRAQVLSNIANVPRECRVEKILGRRAHAMVEKIFYDDFDYGAHQSLDSRLVAGYLPRHVSINSDELRFSRGQLDGIASLNHLVLTSSWLYQTQTI